MRRLNLGGRDLVLRLELLQERYRLNPETRAARAPLGIRRPGSSAPKDCFDLNHGPSPYNDNDGYLEIVFNNPKEDERRSMYEVIKDLLQGTEFSIVESFQTPGREARYAEIPSFLLDSPVGAYLAQWSREANGGESGLWSHQVEALSGLGRGENVVISTGTASGQEPGFPGFGHAQSSAGPVGQSCRVLSASGTRSRPTPRLEEDGSRSQSR